MRNWLKAALASLFVAVAPIGASAHPHVWVLADAALVFEGDEIVAVDVDWKFDGFFSLILFEDFDWDKDGAFSEDEIDAMRDGAFSGLGEVGFFTHLSKGGEIQPWGTPSNFSVGVHEGGEVVSYGFKLTLAEPVPYKGAEVSLSLYDPDFYVYVGPDEEGGLTVTGRPPGDCSFEIMEDTSVSIYFDTVHPDKAVLTCGAETQS